MHSFCDNPAKKFNAEYVFTVATARAISRRNGPFAEPYEIRIEHSTKIFARDCLPLLKRVGRPLQRGSTILRSMHKIPSILRGGRIDIAIYSDPMTSSSVGREPLCAIELKGFNPQRYLIIEDLRRNLSFHRLIGVTGRSLLHLSFFAALHSCNVEQGIDNENAIRSKYLKWFSELGDIKDISTRVLTFTVSIDSLGRLIDEVDEIVCDRSTLHHFIGVIVVFESL